MSSDAISRCTVLIVEDDLDTRDVLQAILEDEGYRVLPCADGDELLAWRKQLPTLPDLILLDLLMPGIHGEGLLTVMRQHPAWSGIPVVLMSAIQHIDAVATRLDIAAHLAKPFDVEQLLAVVHAHCTLRSRTAG